MSIANLINSNPAIPNNVNTLIYCQGLRASDTVKANSILSVGESTFLDKLNIFGLCHEYGDMIIDGTLTVGGGITGGTGTYNTINAVNGNIDHIVCQDIVGGTATFDYMQGMTGGFNFMGVSEIQGHNAHFDQDVSGNTGSFNDLNVSNSAQIEYTYNNKKDVVPRLNTTDRDTIGGEDGALIYNTDVTNPQFYGNGYWDNLGYYPQMGQWFLNNDETVTNANLHIFGQDTDLGEVFFSNVNGFFEYAGAGVFKIHKPGIYKVSCLVALQPPTTIFTSLQVYIYFGKTDTTKMFSCIGFTDNVGPLYYVNKEQKYLYEDTILIEDDTDYSFFVWQDNNTADDFHIVTNPYAPFNTGMHNCLCNIQFVSPKF